MSFNTAVIYTSENLSVISASDHWWYGGMVEGMMNSHYVATTQVIPGDEYQLMVCIYSYAKELKSIEGLCNELFPEINGVFDVISENAIILGKKEAFIFAIKYGI